MLSQQEYYILTFETNADVMYAEKRIQEHFAITIMPVPGEFHSGCGLAIRFLDPDETSILTFCRTLPLHGTLYKMQMRRENGRRPFEKLLSF
ncbi:DUF3343 domain-containing protein [Bariatricus sp. HCP28S3_E4]|uniref:DUF3343 domain-containing protein n=1 Tax=unclassified Bariatricus TaxID=2677046 RepID=UPI002A7A341A|nr:DUF3343 domain-containing protein [bacterium]MDY2885625.1 DUF3343 domain-containing protein [Bariatricus sp.]